MLHDHPLLGKNIGTLYNFNTIESSSFLMQRTDTKAKHCRISNGMNETNKFLSMKMMRTKKEACEDKISEKRCQKMKNQCKTEKVARVCKKTCGYCQDDCYHTLENLHCLSKE